MLFNSALFLAAGHCLVAMAAPTTEASAASVAASQLEFIIAPNGVQRTKEEIHQALVELAKPASSEVKRSEELHEFSRRSMTVGKKYISDGWVVIVGEYIVERFSGTSWKFPKDVISIAYIADQVASSMNSVIGNGDVARNVGGGWSWHGQILQDHYEFSEIPNWLLYSLIYDAIKGATDWISNDNAFEFIIHDTNKLAILQLKVGPTVHGGLDVWHDEF